MKICFVTEEFAGLNRSGGIGACVAGLARLYAQDGHNVSVLVTDLSCDLRRYPTSKNNISFHYLADASFDDVSRTDGGSKEKSYLVFCFLKKHKYDVVHFHEYLGLGHYACMARRQGLLDSIVVTHTHGSHVWTRRYNLQSPTIDILEFEGMER
ncbi:MAG: glycosyltransferase, partial [Methylocystis sp.]